MSIEDKIIDTLTKKNYKGAILGMALIFSKAIPNKKENPEKNGG